MNTPPERVDEALRTSRDQSNRVELALRMSTDSSISTELLPDAMKWVARNYLPFLYTN